MPICPESFRRSPSGAAQWQAGGSVGATGIDRGNTLHADAAKSCRVTGYGVKKKKGSGP